MAGPSGPSIRSGLLPILLPLVVWACATLEPAPRAQEFPFHSTEGPYRLHWRLERESWAARAIGFVEAPRPESWDRDLVVELRGVSRTGQVLSRDFARTHHGQFTVQLRLRGGEDRIELALAEISTGGRSDR
jgi:hypothetical protein